MVHRTLRKLFRAFCIFDQASPRWKNFQHFLFLVFQFSFLHLSLCLFHFIFFFSFFFISLSLSLSLSSLSLISQSYLSRSQSFLSPLSILSLSFSVFHLRHLTYLYHLSNPFLCVTLTINFILHFFISPPNPTSSLWLYFPRIGIAFVSLTSRLECLFSVTFVSFSTNQPDTFLLVCNLLIEVSSCFKALSFSLCNEYFDISSFSLSTLGIDLPVYLNLSFCSLWQLSLCFFQTLPFLFAVSFLYNSNQSLSG